MAPRWANLSSGGGGFPKNNNFTPSMTSLGIKYLNNL